MREVTSATGPELATIGADAALEVAAAVLDGDAAEVLKEAEGPRGDGRLSGRTERHEIVHLAPGLALGDIVDIVPVRVQRAFRHSLEGAGVGADAVHAGGPRRLPIVSPDPG